MKERELRAAATCGLCGKKIGHTRLPLFWRVTIERWGIKANAVMRQAGLEMMMGGNVGLAQAFSPDEDMAVRVMDPVTITVCETCAVEKAVPVMVMLPDEDEKPEEPQSVGESIHGSDIR